jgi:IclR family transcriptional regulator, acetate operon repressor
MIEDRVTGDHGEIRCVGRALDLLEIMQRAAPAGIRVADAAAHLGVDPATASRLLATLISRGYASRTPNRRYTLGARSLRLATGWVDRLMQVAAAPMARIANSCGETVYLLQLIGTEAVTVARLAGNRRAMVAGEIGPSYPLWATAAGRALLGSLPRTQAPSLLPPEPFPAFTPRTKTTWADVSAAIAEGRRNGMYAEEGEIDPFLNCCAAPLLHGERDEKLALAVSFEAGRPERDRRAIREALRREWRELTWQI